MRNRRRVLASAGVLILLAAASAQAQIDIVTERYDPGRLGANLQESTLNASNVNVGQFGKLWSYTVSGSVYAQPLYVRNVAIPGQGTYNVLYVVTMNDWVYAFDADSASNTPLLSLDLTSQVPGSTPVPITDIVDAINVVGNLGIQSTPHIDVATNTMYLLAQTKEPAGSCGSLRSGRYCHRLHALDITTFAEKFGGPTLVQASVPGNGPGSSGGMLTFDALLQTQRSSLAYANGRIFMSWSSHEDFGDYHGWIMSYDATTLQQTSAWSTTPNGDRGGVWMAGRAPAVDAAGNVYYVTGNGAYDGTQNWGETFLKLASAPQFTVLDWFTPSVWQTLNGNDADLGGSGPMLLPGTDLIVGAGKSGVFYLTHTADQGMGHLNNPDQIVQSLNNGNQQIKGGPVYWNRSGGLGPWMYVWADNRSRLTAYHFNGTTFDTTPASQSTLVSAGASSGGVLTLSANGSASGSGILWASIPVAGTGDPNGGVHAGALRAFDADDLTRELWNSNINQARDNSGNWPKFSPPTVINGRVYLASFPTDGRSNAPLNVYGLLPQPDFALAATPANPGVNPGGSASYTINASALQNFSGSVHFEVSGLPPQASASFSPSDVTAPGSTTLTVHTAAATPLGESVLTITATSGALTHTQQVGLYVTAAAPGAGKISVDFVGGGVAMNAVEMAGVAVEPNWNLASGTSGSGLALFDESGVATGATLSWSASSAATLGLADAAGDVRLMNGYLDGGSGSLSLSVANLPVNPSGYYVYVYADGANGSATRSTDYAIGAQHVLVTDAAGANFSGSFVRADGGDGNYAVFFVGGSGFSLTATPGVSSDGTPQAPLNGLQIVPGDRIFADGFD